MFKYQALIKENLKEIAKLITLEQGKTIPDAEGDVMRGLQVCKICSVVPKHHYILWKFDISDTKMSHYELFSLFVFWAIEVFSFHISLTFQVVEHCCSNTNILMGETLPGITKDMDLTSYKTPLGVCAGIAPFNFPAMIPLWLVCHQSF